MSLFGIVFNNYSQRRRWNVENRCVATMKKTNINDIEKEYFDLKTKYFKIRTDYNAMRRSKDFDLKELLLLAEEFGACQERFVNFRENYGHLITVER